MLPVYDSHDSANLDLTSLLDNLSFFLDELVPSLGSDMQNAVYDPVSGKFNDKSSQLEFDTLQALKFVVDKMQKKDDDIELTLNGLSNTGTLDPFECRVLHNLIVKFENESR